MVGRAANRAGSSPALAKTKIKETYMPKITEIKADIGGKAFTFVINYNKKFRFYTNSMPDYILEDVGMGVHDFRFHDTLETLEKKINETVKKFRDVKRVTEKVIDLTLRFGVELDTREPTKFTESQSSFRSDEISGYGLTFDWMVCFRETIGDNVIYKRINDYDGEETPGSIRAFAPDGIIIEWTQEREDFLNSLKDQMEGMAKAFVKFFGEDDFEAKMIAANAQNLLE